MNDLHPPRYAPLRSLPERAFIPGRSPKPSPDEEAAVYRAAEHWRDSAAYLWGVDLYNHGYAWEAHEAWEGLWRAAKHDEVQATFLQGLIQCAAAEIKAAMGDMPAAQRLRERGLARLARVRDDQGNRYMGLELARYVAEHAAHGASKAVPKLWLTP